MDKWFFNSPGIVGYILLHRSVFSGHSFVIESDEFWAIVSFEM